jgi:hypothetical protein
VLVLFGCVYSIPEQFSLLVSFLNLHLDTFPGGCSRKCNVELTVAEYGLRELDADPIECPSLRLVDGHGKSQKYRELQSFESK